MKIAFLNRSRALWSGGDMVGLDLTVEALNKIDGIEAKYYDVNEEIPSDVDICHLFHCNFSWASENLYRAHGKKIVCTPIFYPTFGLDDARLVIANSHLITPFSYRELSEIQSIGVHVSSYEIVANGTDYAFFSDGDDQESYSSRAGVMTSCARYPDKNVDKVLAACTTLGIPCSIVSGVSHNELPSKYWSSRVFVNASDSERMSLSIGEALCAGCRVIATSENRGNEWYGDNLCVYELGVDELSDLIDAAYNFVEWDYSPNRIARTLTWNSVARQLHDAYTSLLKS